MTAYQLLQDYMQEYGMLPPEGDEYQELDAYAQRRKVDTPDSDSVIAVCQMMRRQQQEAAGQGRLF